MLKVGVVGVTGYTGEELLRLLLGHSRVEIAALSAKIQKPKDISEIFPWVSDRIQVVCKELDIEELKGSCELVFLALPHRISMEVAPPLLEAGKRVIDLSADYRLKDLSLYQNWYEIVHKSPQYVPEAVYGLPELYREEIKDARIVANPGCFPTGIILGLAPLIKGDLIRKDWIVIDSKTGISGAGRWSPLVQEFNEGKRLLKAYKINQHQHSPEINQELSKLAGEQIQVIFTPHVVPLERGILNSIYVRLKSDGLNTKDALKNYRDFYNNEPLVKICPEGTFPELKGNLFTNHCQLGLKIDGELAVIICCLDNLLKGAAGQAVQNMNIMYGFPETEGLL